MHIPIRQTVAARVVPDQSVLFRKFKEETLKNRQLPIIFEVTKPMRRPQHGRSVADPRVCQPDTIRRLAIANLLLEICGSEKSGAGRCRDIEANRINLHRLGDVLEILSTEFAIAQIKFAVDLIEHLARNADATAVGDTLQSRGDIDAVAHQIAVALLDDIAEVDADAEFDAALGWNASITLDHAVLDLDGAAHGVDHTAELNDTSVPSALHYAPVMYGYGWINQIAPERPQSGQCSIFVGASKPAISDHVRH